MTKIVQRAVAQSPKGTQRADVRLVLGRPRGNDALFPVPPPEAGLPRSYARTLRDIKERIGTPAEGRAPMTARRRAEHHHRFGSSCCKIGPIVTGARR